MSGSTFGMAILFGALAFGIALGAGGMGWAIFWGCVIGSLILGLGRFHEIKDGARFDLVDGIAVAAALGTAGWLIGTSEQHGLDLNAAGFLGLFVALGLYGGLNFLLRVLFTIHGSGEQRARSRYSLQEVLNRKRAQAAGDVSPSEIDPGRFGYGRGGEAGPGPYGEEPFPPPYGRGRPGGTYAGEEGTDAPRLEEAWTPEGYSTQDAARYFQMTGITGSASSTEQAREFARRIKLGLGGDAPGYAFLAAGARDHHLPKHIRAFYAHALQLCDRGQA